MVPSDNLFGLADFRIDTGDYHSSQVLVRFRDEAPADVDAERLGHSLVAGG